MLRQRRAHQHRLRFLPVSLPSPMIILRVDFTSLCLATQQLESRCQRLGTGVSITFCDRELGELGTKPSASLPVDLRQGDTGLEALNVFTATSTSSCACPSDDSSTYNLTEARHDTLQPNNKSGSGGPGEFDMLMLLSHEQLFSTTYTGAKVRTSADSFITLDPSPTGVSGPSASTNSPRLPVQVPEVAKPWVLTRPPRPTVRYPAPPYPLPRTPPTMRQSALHIRSDHSGNLKTAPVPVPGGSASQLPDHLTRAVNGIIRLCHLLPSSWATQR